MRTLLGLLFIILLLPVGANARSAAIASAHPLATQAGFEILAAGGNAFDAAVAVSAALAVVEPYSSGLGGGGFWLLHVAKDKRYVMIDGRETAPAAATADMYQDKNGKVMRDWALNGPSAAAIPGEPAALAWLADHYGKLGLAKDLAPAIAFAKNGFPADDHYRKLANFRRDVINRFPDTRAIFLHNGNVPDKNQLIVQTDLAATLSALASEGHAGFYEGAVAKKLVDGVQSMGGIWTLDDLKHYQVKEREPISGSFRGARIISAAPPSSGGLVLLEALHILEQFDAQQLSPTLTPHLVVEALRRAYHDRATLMGDPDFVSIPTAKLLSDDYAQTQAASISLDHATPSSSLGKPVAVPQGMHTTHFSIVDGDGNYVAATLSINYPFGSGFVAPGTGVLLNDEMDDFSAKPGVPNVYGLVGSSANAIAPGKRPLSSMTPTFVEWDGKVAVLGTPGGSRIISMVLLGVLDALAGNPPSQWVAAPRYHEQYLPDEVQAEPVFVGSKAAVMLMNKGNRVVSTGRPYGNMQAILWNRKTGSLEAASDPRGIGEALVGTPSTLIKDWQKPKPAPAKATATTHQD